MITNNTSSFLGRWAGRAAKGYKGGGENVGLGDRRAAHPDQTHTHTHVKARQNAHCEYVWYSLCK